MQSGPNFRADLCIIVEAEGGEFAAFAGLWVDPFNRLAYVEPVATDPENRRRGLASAAVTEGIRRCRELGATVVYVGANKPLYRSLGFEEIGALTCWRRS